MNESQSFGEWLRHRRRELDLTQEELARQTGCARITIRKIEADQMHPSKQLSELLREHLGIPAGEREDFIHFARGRESAKPVAVIVPRHNLPIPVSSFIGREREIAEVKRLIESSRLITLTGAGGSGKTRLALQVAGQVLDQFPEGVWFISFAPLSEPTLVQQTIASALKVRENPSQPLIQTLADYLHSKKLLLLFDNCEHLIAECAQTAERLLQACPQLHIMVTSREALSIAGEEQYYVPTLSLPEVKGTTSLEKLMRSEAVRLFIERAKAIKPDFTLTGKNAEVVIQICQHLDGMPLALELAAAQVKGLSVEQIAGHLDDRFHLLTGGSRTALPRQRTLLATIDWSYKLLSEEERIVLRRLAVFVGGWTLEAAEAVCGFGEGSSLDQTLNLQLRLIDKSLVVPETEGGEPRYRMLETIRQYAQEKLEETGEAGKVRAKHLDFFLAWGEQAGLGFRGREYRRWLDRMDKERDNLRSALGYAINSGQSESALRLVGATFWVWWIRGPWSEGQRWAETALARSSDEHTAAKARVLIALGIFNCMRSDILEGCKWSEQSIAIWRKLEDKWWQALSISLLGYFLINRQAAFDLLREGLWLAREVDDKWLLATCLLSLGVSELRQGNPSEARTRFEESLGLIQALGDHMMRQDVIKGLGEVAATEKDYPRALRWYEEGLVLAHEIGDIDSIINLGFCTGYVFQCCGDNDQAAHLFRESLQVAVRSGEKYSLLRALAGLGVVAQARGDSCRAVRLLQASESLFDNLYGRISIDLIERAWFEQYLAAARAQLGEERFLALRKEGQAMTLEQVIQYASEDVTEE